MPRTAGLLLLLLALSGVASAEEPAPEDASAPSWTVEQRDAALEKAFSYLDDHLWKLSVGGSPTQPYSAAVAGWAYLLAGERGGKRLPSRTKQIERIRDHLEQYLDGTERVYERSSEDGARRPPHGPGGMPDMGRMQATQFAWPLSMAAHFCAESMARGKKKRASKSMLKRIVAILERSQQPNGGWGHDDAQVPGLGIPTDGLPIPGGYPKTLLAATNCAASALGTAQRLLKMREPESRANATRYYREAQSPDGSFPYDPSQKMPARMPAMSGGRDPFVLDRARSAGALYALYCLGVEADDETATKADELLEHSLADMSEGHGSATMALQFGALLSRAQGDERWNAFRTIFFPRILAQQDAAGAFACVCLHESAGVTCDSEPPGGLGAMPGYMEGQRVYVTAIHCLVLLLDRAPSRCAPPQAAAKGPVTPR